MLVIENLNLEKDNTSILSKVSFELEDGESLAIIGDYNSGKSELLSCLAGLEVDFKGSISYQQNYCTNNKSPRTALVLANPENQFVSFSVEQELAFSLENISIPAQEIESKIQKCLIDFNLTQLAKQPPAQLSGGEKQRAVLASMLILEPDILLLDDPCSMLDEQSKTQLLNIIFKSSIKQIILATNNTEETLFCTNLMVMDGGKVLFLGKTESIYLQYYQQILSLNIDLPLEILKKISCIL